MQRVPLFTASPLSLQKRLLLLLKPVSYPPGTIIFEANEIGDEIMFITVQGMVTRSRIDDIRLVGRNTQGVRVMNVNEGDRVVSLAKIAPENVAEERATPAP